VPMSERRRLAWCRDPLRRRFFIRSRSTRGARHAVLLDLDLIEIGEAQVIALALPHDHFGTRPGVVLHTPSSNFARVRRRSMQRDRPCGRAKPQVATENGSRPRLPPERKASAS